MDTYGTHGLSCRYSGGHLPRHVSVNETIRHALVSNRKTEETITMHIFPYFSIFYYFNEF